MMTRKDYVSTAKILNGYVNKIDFIDLSQMAIQFAEMFEKDNQRFDTQRFIDAVFEDRD